MNSPSNSHPLVSISVITYNHAAYIRQALDGILMQKTNFEYEVIIGDDVSTDHTREILLEYKDKHPKQIQLILHEKKHGGIPGKMNFVSTIHAAKGKYVALLDGDDYWTDPDKLQKQVDFLDSHSEYSFCFHNAQIVFEGVEGKDRIYHPVKEDTTYQIDDLVLNPWFIHSGSIVYRRELFPKVKDSFYELPSGDIPIGITLASQGPVKFLADVMSVYRKNPTSVTGSAEPHKFIPALHSRILILKTLDNDLNHSYKDLFDRAISGYQLQLAKYSLRSGDHKGLKQWLKKVEPQKNDLSAADQKLFQQLKFLSYSIVLQKLVLTGLNIRNSFR